MKIFGKRKSLKPSVDSTEKTATNDSPTQVVSTTTSPANDNIPSYFSTSNDEPKKKKPKKNPTNEINGEDLETLLQMDYEQLNSKQRRLVRRHRERSGEVKSSEEKGTDGAAADTTSCDSKVETINDSSLKLAEPVESNPMNDHENELLLKLEPLNSKDRRKFLRELRNNNPNNIDIERLEEEAKRIADRNIRQSKEPSKPTKKEEEEKPTIKPKSKSSKKKQKDLSHLTPEEIARREQQRQMQIQAAERRARGEDLNHGHKHPLNSERRRANRRKPARKSQGHGRGGMKGEFNSVGYQMRKNA